MIKKSVLFILFIYLVSVLTSCSGTIDSPIIDLSEATEIGVIHIRGGRQQKWNIDSKTDIDNLAEWLSGLTLKLKHYEKGKSPGDSDGGEIYMFSIDNKEFSYIKNGPDNCFILYNSDWFRVSNPTDPFSEK